MYKLLVLTLVLLISPIVNATPIATLTTGNGTVISLHDEDCSLKNDVINLPARITWNDNGKITEGCYTIGYPRLGYMVLVYFADKSVVLIPLGFFTKVEAV